MVLLNTKVTKNTENQKIKKQPPLPCGEGLGGALRSLRYLIFTVKVFVFQKKTKLHR